MTERPRLADPASRIAAVRAAMRRRPDDGDAAKGFLIGFLLAVPMWTVIIGLVLALVR